MRKKKGTARILAFILCLLMVICSIDLSTLEVQASNDTTIVDVTGLATGAETSHDCSKYLTSKYNSLQHWQECTICGKVYGNKTNHNLIDNGWTMGNASYCGESNVHKYICYCGYYTSNTNGRAAHKYSYAINGGNARQHYYNCSICGASYGHKNCYDDEGILGCNNPGVCKISGHSTNERHWGVYNSDGYFYCTRYVVNGQWNSNTEKLAKLISQSVSSDGNITTVKTVIQLLSGSHKGASSLAFSTLLSVVGTETTVNGSYVTIIQKYQWNQHSENAITTSFLNYTDDIGSYVEKYLAIKPDYTAPVISNISQTNISVSNGWATQKKITVTGTENYCNSVKLTVKDNNGNYYLNNASVAISSNNWSYSFIPNIEADANGKTFIVTATDTLGNSSTKTFIVYKTDKKAPTTTSVNTTSTNWSKSKSYTASATDEGSGKVQIAFNNTSGYALATANGTSFSRNYTFTGDVYGNVTAAVYFKDAVGNERTNFIKIYNIDNTAPTITDVTGSAVEDEKVEFVVSANDNKDFGGTVGIKSGSGVSKYAISSNNTAPASGWQTSNKLYATSPGTYYIFVKDAVGNISKSYQVEVVKLVLNFNGGKFNSSSSSKVMLGAICGSKTSHTFDIAKYYGTLAGTGYNSKGLNTKLTKTDTNGIQYRFLGYSLDPDATVPDANFDVYAKDTRIENYTIRDNTTLYAVWEPVLQMTVQLSAPSHPGTIELTDDLPVNTTLGNFKILSGTKNTDLPSSGTASVNPATIGTNVTNKDSVTYTVTAKGASSIKFSTAADSRILDIYNHGKNNPWFDNLNEVKDFNYSINDFTSTTGSFTIPQYLGTTQSYQTSNPDLATGTTVYAIKFTCTQPSYYYDKYWNSDESTSVYCILFLKATASSGTTGGNTGGTGGSTGGSTGDINLPPYAVEDGMYDFQTILN